MLKITNNRQLYDFIPLCNFGNVHVTYTLWVSSFQDVNVLSFSRDSLIVCVQWMSITVYQFKYSWKFYFAFMILSWFCTKNKKNANFFPFIVNVYGKKSMLLNYILIVKLMFLLLALFDFVFRFIVCRHQLCSDAKYCFKTEPQFRAGVNISQW